jgi:hypothetical protein
MSARIARSGCSGNKGLQRQLGRTASAADLPVPSSAGSSCAAAYGTAPSAEQENRDVITFVSSLLLDP